jgi:hypothetical protein
MAYIFKRSGAQESTSRISGTYERADKFQKTLAGQLAFQEAKPVLAVKRKKQTRVTVTYTVASAPDFGLSSSVALSAAVSSTPALVATATLCDSVA